MAQRMLVRRPVRKMSNMRRGEGLSIREIMEIRRLRRRRRNIEMFMLVNLHDDSEESSDTSDSNSDSDSGSESEDESDDDNLMILVSHGMVTRRIRNLRYKIPDPIPPIGVEKKNRLLDSFTNQECYDQLRFRRGHIQEMLRGFNFPYYLTIGNGGKVRSETAFLFMLRRLAFWQPLREYRDEWHRSPSQLSEMFNLMVRRLNRDYSHCVYGNLD